LAYRRAPLTTDFALSGCFRKTFCTKSAEVVQNCMQMLNCFPVQ